MAGKNGLKEVDVPVWVDGSDYLVTVWLSEEELSSTGERYVTAVRKAIENEILVGDQTDKIFVVEDEESTSDNENLGRFVTPDEIEPKPKSIDIN